jgi:hypothetical protein
MEVNGERYALVTLSQSNEPPVYTGCEAPEPVWTLDPAGNQTPIQPVGSSLHREVYPML